MLGWLLALSAPVAAEALDYNQPPINYCDSAPNDVVGHLIRRLEAGTIRLEYDRRFGYLPAVLKALDIPRSSQVLVFSKTSLQHERIAPTTPRALYFNDEVYVGTVIGGAVLELAGTDPRQGTMFYVLDQREQEHPRPRRQTDECLQCHDSTAFTGGVPGLIMRSVYPDETGRPLLTLGSTITTPASAWESRWGGWYVTGHHGRMRHLGNQTFDDGADLNAIDRRPGANLTSLDRFIDTRNYLEPTSDIVALMALSHQIQMHNLITRSGFETRIALRDEEVMNQALGRPTGYRMESTTRRLRSAAEALVQGLLYLGEAELSEPVSGNSSFVADFTNHGGLDAYGTRLHDLNLQYRFARLPCSYLIRSDAFAQLPAELKSMVFDQIWDALDGRGANAGYHAIAAATCRKVAELMKASLPDLPESWSAAKASPAP